MKSSRTIGVNLAELHAERFRVVPYVQLRRYANVVAEQMLEAYRGQKIVAAPILMGGGMPARLIIDALLGFNIVTEVVPCRIRRYNGIGTAGVAEFTVELDEAQVRNRIVVGIDDLVDGGQTLATFRMHAIERGASEVTEAVIFEKPNSTIQPRFCAERGVIQWLVMPGEENDFMTTISQTDPEVAVLAMTEKLAYFETLGILRQTVDDWSKLSKSLSIQA
jgi:hypoxanthine-guanine phosphoribosyltransferase